MAFKKKTTKKVEVEPVVVEEAKEPPVILQYQVVKEPVNPAAAFEKEDIIEIKDEAVVEVIPEPVVVIADQNQINIDRLKEKLINGTITDGEAAEYRSLMGL